MIDLSEAILRGSNEEILLKKHCRQIDRKNFRSGKEIDRNLYFRLRFCLVNLSTYYLFKIKKN